MFSENMLNVAISMQLKYYLKCYRTMIGKKDDE